MDSDKIDIHINIGSNSGHRKALIERAVAVISASFPGEIRVSGFIETEPWGFDSPNRFLNVGVMVRTTAGTLFEASTSGVTETTLHPDADMENHRAGSRPGADALKNVPTASTASRVEIALSVLDRLLEIQRSIDPSPHRAPDGSYIDRAIDIDLIAIGDWVISTPRLILPHPRMHLRDFVLRPLSQLAPGWHHPLIGKTLSELMRINIY